MIHDFTEEQTSISAIAYDFAEKKIKPLRREYDEKEEYPLDILDEMKKMDLFGLCLPEAYGGIGGGITSLALAIEQMSRICAGISLPVATSALGTIPLLLYATDEQRNKWLPDISSGKKLVAFALTEPEAGSDATSIKTTAVKDGDDYIVNGSKHFCSSGKISDLYVVFVSTNPKKGARGISVLLIDKDTPGFTMGKKEKKLGIKANPTYELNFENCKVPVSNRLGGEGFGLFILQETFDYSRPGVAAQAVGIAQGALDETIPYLKGRQQFGQSLASFQGVGHKLAELATKIEAARALVYTLSKAMDKVLLKAIKNALENKTPVKQELKILSKRRWTKESAMAKLYASDTAFEVAQECINLCGGIGYMRDFPVEKFMRDAKVTQIYEGSNYIQKNEIAASLIKEYTK